MFFDNPLLCGELAYLLITRQVKLLSNLLQITYDIIVLTVTERCTLETSYGQLFWISRPERSELLMQGHVLI